MSATDDATAADVGVTLVVTDLDAGYGDLQVLHGVDLTIKSGEYCRSQ